MIVSFEYRTTSNLNYTYLLRKESTKGNFGLKRSYFESEPLADGEWHKQVIKFKATSDIDNFRLLVGSYQPEVGTFLEVKKFKVELGNIATDWSPAPEDIESSVNAVSADLTTYKATQANIDKAQTDQITAHTARLGTAESKISAAEQTLTTLNSSMATKFSEVAANFTTVNNNLTTLNGNLTAAKTELASRITAEERARADGDKANADKLTALTSRVGSAEANLSNMQSTKANKTEVASIAQTALQAVWKADAKTAVDNLQVGGRNLFTGTSKVHTVNSIANYHNAILGITSNIDWATVKALTISCTVQCTGAIGRTTSDGTPRYGANCLIVYTDGSNQWLETWVEPRVGVSTTLNQRVSNTFIIPQGKVIAHIEHHKMQIRAHESGYVSISQAKLEAGTIATDWTPAPEDVDQAVANVSASLISYKATQANVDKAQTDQITAHTARLGTAESKISAAEQTLTTLNSSMATKFSEVSANFTKVNNNLTTLNGNLTTAKTELTARITKEETARANGDKANADNLTALTSRVGTAEGTITSTSRTVATLDGKVQALHTIQAVAISGGKKAIAGISMGASGSESSVIVMADKFNVVKNAQDGTVKPMFGVVNNKVAVNGDLIADGARTVRSLRV